MCRLSCHASLFLVLGLGAPACGDDSGSTASAEATSLSESGTQTSPSESESSATDIDTGDGDGDDAGDGDTDSGDGDGDTGDGDGDGDGDTCPLWTAQLGTDVDDNGYSIALNTSNGDVYVAGTTRGELDGNTSLGSGDMFVTKYNSAGEKMWTEQLGTEAKDEGRAVTVNDAGEAYVTGRVGGDLDGNMNAGLSDAFLVKYDADGGKLWTQLLGSSNEDEGWDLALGADGSVYLTGSTSGELDGNTNAGATDLFLAKYDSEGTKIWTRLLGSDAGEGGRRIAVGDSGDIYIAGSTAGDLDGNVGAGGQDAFVAKFNSDGDKQWTTQFGTSEIDTGMGIAVDGDGNAYLTGFTDGDLEGNSNLGGRDSYLAKLGSDGEKLWTLQLGTSSWDEGYAVAVDPDDAVYVTGVTIGTLEDNTSAGDLDIFVSKYNGVGEGLWAQQYGSSTANEAQDIVVDADGQAHVAGYTEGNLGENTSAGGPDFFVTKFCAP